MPLPHAGAGDELELDQGRTPSTTTRVQDAEQYVHDTPAGAMQGCPFIAPKSHCSWPSTSLLPQTGADDDEEEDEEVPATGVILTGWATPMPADTESVTAMVPFAVDTVTPEIQFDCAFLSPGT